jgi:Flp pilus assembly protein TadG
VVIKLFFALLVLCTAALVIVALAIHFRVKRHLRQQQMDAQVRAVIEDATESTTKEKTS